MKCWISQLPQPHEPMTEILRFPHLRILGSNVISCSDHQFYILFWLKLGFTGWGQLWGDSSDR